MKTLTSIFLLLSTFSVFGQSIQRNEIDEGTNTRVITTSPWDGEKPETDQPSIYPSFKYIKTDNGRVLYFLSFKILNVDNIGCLREKNGQALIHFANGEEMLLRQQSDTNCDYGDYKVSYYLVSTEVAKDPSWAEKMEEHYHQLLSDKIEAITIKGSKDIYRFDLQGEQQNLVAQHAETLKEAIQETK
ncbi:hypothetical protein [Chondrinema litorale]|uniref:hypothetical protein n=1 Tax=Chondrinema litorale TaxID=2994555 RepID=UPI0025430F63|nr:hypothetical protein [Chondrinema litorale]UZR93930.1 hypothetical protein OQ292_18960 [Chondrinema litorale]